MYRKGLEWAQRLRADLVVRIEDLRVALAEVEPLRQELERLQGQLRGVDRLIAIHHAQRGLTAASEIGEPAASRLPENHTHPTQAAGHARSPVPDAAMPQPAPRQEPFRVEPYLRLAASRLSRVQPWLAKHLRQIRNTPRAEAIARQVLRLRLWFVQRFLRPSA